MWYTEEVLFFYYYIGKKKIAQSSIYLEQIHCNEAWSDNHDLRSTECRCHYL